MWNKFIKSKFYQKYIWKSYISRKYKSVDEMCILIRDNAVYQEVYYIIRRFILGIIDFPRDIYRAIKRGLQRGYRGWADEDVWSLHSYYSKIILESLIRLKNTKHGIPTSCINDCCEIDKTGNPTDKEFELTENKWNEDLDKIIYTFHTAQLISDGNYHYTKTKMFDEKEYLKLKNHFKDYDIIVMSYEDCLRYEEGFKLFQKHFYSFWD